MMQKEKKEEVEVANQEINKRLGNAIKRLIEIHEKELRQQSRKQVSQQSEVKWMIKVRMFIIGKISVYNDHIRLSWDILARWE